MLSRRGLQIASLVWAIIGWSVALTGLGQVNADARLLVAAASAAFPLAAVGAFPALDRGMDRTAGALLIVSAATPTYFAYAINLPALLVGPSDLAGARRRPARDWVHRSRHAHRGEPSGGAHHWRPPALFTRLERTSDRLRPALQPTPVNRHGCTAMAYKQGVRHGRSDRCRHAGR